ncbi:GNAT family N-acetyltransferase [Gilliamella sp. CG25]|uniref:GNAT family N-acetyltransferase n=1 Tax=unclassified Gilliamella TaxID=2685620 RepID=UPI003986BCC1
MEILKDNMIIYGALPYLAYHTGFKIEWYTTKQKSRKEQGLMCLDKLILICFYCRILTCRDADKALSLKMLNHLNFSVKSSYQTYFVSNL